MPKHRNPQKRRQEPDENLVLHPHTKLRRPKICITFKGPSGSDLKFEGTYCKFSGFLRRFHNMAEVLSVIYKWHMQKSSYKQNLTSTPAIYAGCRPVKAQHITIEQNFCSSVCTKCRWSRRTGVNCHSQMACPIQVHKARCVSNSLVDPSNTIPRGIMFTCENVMKTYMYYISISNR